VRSLRPVEPVKVDPMAARDDPVTDQVPDRGLVVVVEDESVIADVVRRYLAAAGFGVRICRTGQEGLAAVRADRPPSAPRCSRRWPPGSSTTWPSPSDRASRWSAAGRATPS